MSDDKVIHAFPAAELPENLLTIEPKPVGAPYFCSHEKISLNEHDRTVNCSKCGQTLDPFNFLLKNAQTIQMAWQNHRMASQKVGELNERIMSLTKEEKRLRSQVKRLQDKAGSVIDVRGKSTL
jgi:uncharacterized small protein (DUF1192 family)